MLLLLSTSAWHCSYQQQQKVQQPVVHLLFGMTCQKASKQQINAPLGDVMLLKFVQ